MQISNIIVGRHKEQRILEKIYQSDTAEFVVAYGRHRVGKTFLIKHFFDKKNCKFFHMTGQNDAVMRDQIYEFTRRISRAFTNGRDQFKEPANWTSAFELLTSLIQDNWLAQDDPGAKVVVFFDELPWLASKKSKCLQALDYYWNQYWSEMPAIKLIVCGSAASWMLDNIINNKGGLHNRLTKSILLEPFTLLETREYLHHRNINYTNKQISDLYMITGGVPYYLKGIERELSVAQNIDKLCFSSDGLLFREFKKLFASLFKESSAYMELIRIIAKSRKGISGAEIAKLSKNISLGGRLYKRLEELEAAGFIFGYVPYGFQHKNYYYRIIDEYTLFYLNWIEPVTRTLAKKDFPSGYWEGKMKSASYKSWAGYSFEGICYKHLHIIRKVLDIPPTALASNWRYIPKRDSKEEGAQIDLLFNRDDDVVTICEIKYRMPEYCFNKEEAHKLWDKEKVFRKRTKTHKQIQFAVITAMPLKKTMYSSEVLVGSVCMDEFFNDRNYE